MSSHMGHRVISYYTAWENALVHWKPATSILKVVRDIGQYSPMNRDSEDALHVGHHDFKMFWIFLEAHFCQYEGFGDV